MRERGSAEEFCRQLWRQYLVERRYDLVEQVVADQFSLIGTGVHEINRSRAEFIAAMRRESREWGGRFLIKDQWYQEQILAETLSLVMGEILMGQDAGDGVLYDIRFRFSAVLEWTGERWKVRHIHQSIPDPGQASDEFFPHHLLEKDRSQVVYNLRHDAMTSLLNRRYVRERVDRTLAEWARGAVVMIDIDKFKGLNDSYGHPFGDKVLIAFAQSLKTVFASPGAVGRIGGDEFVAFLPEVTDREGLVAALQRLRDDWDDRQESLGLRRRIQFSAGAAFCPADGTRYDDLWQRADRALYAAKAEKNREL